MQITLKPLSHPELGNIVIEHELFAVGRSETPFSGYDRSVVVNLSRRQARIFVEAGAVYIADLGSRNGTRVNGRPVELKPVKLLSGDRITFGERLQYEIEILAPAEDTDLSRREQFRLTLNPIQRSSKLDTMVISSFPFLVGKFVEPFTKAGRSLPQVLEFMSRRHAYFYARGDAVFVEDLGSTNGTFVNGQRLEESAVPLSDGDELRFGGGDLAYRVSIGGAATETVITNNVQEPSADAVPAEQSEADNTIFISSASSFLDAFTPEQAVPEVEERPPEAGLVGDTDPGTAAGAGRVGLLRRMQTFFEELRGAFGNEGGGSVRRLLLMVLLVAGAAAVTLYVSGKPERDIEKLLAQGQYRQSAALANDYLRENPGSGPVREMALEALLKCVVSDWVELAASDNYGSARALLSEARVLSTDNAAGDALLDLLQWVTELQQFIFDRGGIDGEIILYKHEAPIESILLWWDHDPKEYRSRMRLIEDYVPGFGPSSAMTFTMLRTLRNEKSVYLSAMARLNRNIEDKLATERADELAADIDLAAEQYPRLGGLAPLRDDLQRYLRVRDALAAGDPVRAAIMVHEEAFVTPPFTARAVLLERNYLPSAQVMSQYRQASSAWREGDLNAALQLLEKLAGDRGGELATRELQRKNAVMDDYLELQDFRGQPDFGERILRFHATLDPQEDVYFIQVLEREFERHSAVVEERAGQAWEAAASNWREYRAQGGIRGLLRLEEKVSDEFRQLAALLSAAGHHAGRGRQIDELLAGESSPAREALYGQIQAELTLQRRSLEQLSMVLQVAVLDAKLALLAEPTPATDTP